MSEETTTETTDTTETREPLRTRDQVAKVCTGVGCILLGVAILVKPDASYGA